MRNPYYEPKEGDFPMPVIQGIKDLQERGALFCVCNLALSVYSGVVAQKVDVDPKEVYQEWVDAMHPGIQVGSLRSLGFGQGTGKGLWLYFRK